jgi:hypothetical protein
MNIADNPIPANTAAIGEVMAANGLGIPRETPCQISGRA